jgi:DNA-binding response OmpR family regulator
MHPRIVVAVGDDALRHEALMYCRFLASTNVIEAADSSSAERATDVPFDLLVLDAELPGIAAEALLERFSARIEGRRRVVLLTSGPPARLGHPLVTETVPKPVKIESLLSALDRWRESTPARLRQDPTSAHSSSHR